MEGDDPLRIIAGIILYNPDLQTLKDAVDSIYHQVDQLILVDNASANIKQIYNAFRDYNHIKWIFNKANMGIAKALNQASFKAHNDNYEWILFLDQDSQCSGGFIQEMIKYIKPDIAILTPLILDSRNGSQVLNKADNLRKPRYVKKAITSGSIINIKFLIKFGMFDELMFIDNVDFDYCYRVIDNNKKILFIPSAILNHSIGNLCKRNIGGINLYHNKHNEKRIYFIARNVLYQAAKYGGGFKYIKAVKSEMKLLIEILVFYDNKKFYYKAYLKGIKEFVTMRKQARGNRYEKT